MDFYIDTTPAPSPSLFYSSQAPADRGPTKDRSFLRTTRFVTADFSGLDFGVSEKNGTEHLPVRAMGSNQAVATPFTTQGDSSVPSINGGERYTLAKDQEVNKIAEDRIKILAMKYASDVISTETIARLEILNSRMIERSPRVTSEQVNFLEESISSINSIELSRLARAKRLGLKI